MSLRKELKKAGASKQHAAELAKVASYISKVKPRGLSSRTQKEILGIIGETKAPKHRPAFWVVTSAATAACAVVIIVASLKPPLSKTPMTQQDTDQGTSDVLPAEHMEYIENLAKEHHAELEQLKGVKAEPEQVEKAEQKYRNAFEEFWSRYYRENDERRNRLWQRLYDQAHDTNSKKD